MHLDQADMSLYQNTNMGHPSTALKILASKPRHIKQIIREAIKIEFHPNNMNRENGFSLSRSWKPLRPEGMQEGSFGAQILTLIAFTSAFVLILLWP
jgi:hypothetical protein